MTLAHLHLVLNHFPIIGTVIGLGLFLISLFGKNQDLKRAGLIVLAFTALITLPAFFSGVGAQGAIKGTAGVSPALIGDVLALSGDSVDNIPSAGFGRKTAAKLLAEHGNLDGLLANIEKIKSDRTREKLTAAREQIAQNRKMVELDCDTPLPMPIDDLRIKPDYPALVAALEKCEFKSLLQEVRDEAAKAGTVKQAELLL